MRHQEIDPGDGEQGDDQHELEQEDAPIDRVQQRIQRADLQPDRHGAADDQRQHGHARDVGEAGDQVAGSRRRVGQRCPQRAGHHRQLRQPADPDGGHQQVQPVGGDRAKRVFVGAGMAEQAGERQDGSSTGQRCPG